MPVLDAKCLKKRLGDRVLLDGVDLTIVRGEKIGVVGSNGAGKSTLARILAGQVDADTGEITRRKGAQVAYLEQDPAFPGESSVREVVLGGRPAWFQAWRRYHELSHLLGTAKTATEQHELLEQQHAASTELEQHGGWEATALCDRFLSAVRLPDPEQLVSTLSGGERRRAALARLLFSEPDLAILDEPTNHLDAEAIEWLERYLSDEFQGAVMLITHDRWLLNQVADRTLEVDGGRLYSSEGGWQQFLESRAERQGQEEREERNRQNFLRREIEWLRRQPKARTGKQKARIDRAQDALSVEVRARESAAQFTLAEQRLGSTILEAHDLSVAVGDRTLTRDLSLRLLKGSRLGVLGPSGVGKTTLIRTLLGQLSPLSGRIVLGKNTKIAYLDQLRTGLDATDSVFDAITGGQPNVTVGEQSFSSYSYLERFNFRGNALRQKVAGLSGGEKARVALAKLLLSTANVLILDEPTNDLDVMTLGALEELLTGLSGAAIIVSHDRYFIDKVATEVLSLSRDGSYVQVAGGFSDFVEYQKKRRESLSGGPDRSVAASEVPETKAERSNTAAVPANDKALKKLTYAEALELKKLPERISQLEKLKLELEQQLNDPALYAQNRELVAQLQERYEATKNELETDEFRWLELEERRETSGRS